MTPRAIGGGATFGRGQQMAQKQEIRGKMHVAGITGPIWAMGWLFTIGYAQLPTGKAVLAILLWPYYLGRALI